MNISQDLSIIALIMNASLVVKLIIGLLLILSFLSWWFIFRKAFSISRAIKNTNEFEKQFWSGVDLQSLYVGIQNRILQAGALERIFEAGFREFLKLRTQKNIDRSDLVNSVRRAMWATYQREIDALESHLAFLASVGSVSPYIGLFGTVWGIMNAFRGLANVGQATLAHVAPGIAEALVATAIGLFAAIPAVVAYNKYSTQVDRLSIRFESFMEEFANILNRQAQ